MSSTAILMITWWISQNSGIKVLQIPVHSKEEVPPSSFVRVKDHSSYQLFHISSCVWYSSLVQSGLLITNFLEWKQEVIYFKIGAVVRARMVLPEKFWFIPEKWVFFCFSFDNISKILKVYLDTEVIADKYLDDELEGFEIAKWGDFLYMLQFVYNYFDYIKLLNEYQYVYITP